MRGTGDSDGLMEDEYTAAGAGRTPSTSSPGSPSQPWCTGKVGMMGISWGGFNALQVAALRPPALKAIITLCSTDDRYADDIHYKGGCLLNENLGWGVDHALLLVAPARPGAGRRALARHVAGAAARTSRSWRRSGCEHQTRDDYWKHGSVCEDYRRHQGRGLAVGGWARRLPATPCRACWRNLTAPRQGHHRALGPQVSALRRARPGDRLPAGGAALVGPLAEGQRDRGRERPDAARLHRWTTTGRRARYDDRSGRWVAEASVAVARDPGGGGLPRPPPASLGEPAARDSAVADLAARYAARPAASTARSGSAPSCRRPARATTRSSLCFDSAPLTEPLDILGAPVVELELAADQPVAHARRPAVRRRPGRRLDAHHLRRPQSLPPRRPRRAHARWSPAERYRRAPAARRHAAYRFAAGNRAPRRDLDHLLADGLAVARAGDADRLRRLGAARSCRSRSGGGDEVSFAARRGRAALAERAVLRQPNNARHLEHDVGNRARSGVEIVDDFGAAAIATHGLDHGMHRPRDLEPSDPDDPLSARGPDALDQTMVADDWSVRTETRARRCGSTPPIFTSRDVWKPTKGEALIFERLVPRRQFRGLIERCVDWSRYDTLFTPLMSQSALRRTRVRSISVTSSQSQSAHHEPGEQAHMSMNSIF